tara:strand:- start:26173 stop:27222 length:1050 start_codon:yes stop_codon:yes gene_type:complete
VVGASALLERYGPVIDVIKSDGFDPDAEVYVVLEGENPVAAAKSTGIAVTELATTFDKLKPDVVVSVADRYETIATAIAASYMNIPVAHIQGGEVSGSIDEKVRHAVTKLSDVHFVANDIAAQRVKQMGEIPDRIFVTGCPSIDLAKRISIESKPQFDIFSRYGGVGNIVDLASGYIIVLQHPVTTEYEDSLTQIRATLNAVKELALPTLWFWPNVDAGSDLISKGIRQFRETNEIPFVYFFKNMTPEDFLRTLVNSMCLIGNSSAGVRECSFLGLPVVNIGSRQTGRDRGPNLTDATYNKKSIVSATRNQINKNSLPSSNLYGEGNAGQHIADLLATIPLTIEKRITY